MSDGSLTGDWTRVEWNTIKTPGSRVRNPGFKFSLVTY